MKKELGTYQVWFLEANKYQYYVLGGPSEKCMIHSNDDTSEHSSLCVNLGSLKVHPAPNDNNKMLIPYMILVAMPSYPQGITTRPRI